MDTAPQPPSACPDDRLTKLLAGQWTAHIIHTLGEGGPLGFNALQRALAGVTAKVLSQRLKTMEADGLVWRTEEPTVPPRTTYGLSKRGEELHAAFKQLGQSPP